MNLKEFTKLFENEVLDKGLNLPCFIANEFGTTRMYLTNAVIDNAHKVIVFTGSLKKTKQINAKKLYSACKKNLAKCAKYQLGVSQDENQAIDGKFKIVDNVTYIEGTNKSCTIYFDDEGVINSIYKS